MKKFLFLTMIILSLFFVPTISAYRPNVSINFTDTPDPVTNGTSVNFTINITNFNNDTQGSADDDGNDAYNVTIIINGTVNMTTVGSSVASNFSEGSGGLIFIIYVIPNGTSYNFTVNYTVEGNASGTLTTHLNVTNYTNTTAMDSNNALFNDGPPSMNLTNETTVTVETRRPIIAVTKTDFADPVVNATSVNYTIVVSNTGNMTAYNITLVENYTFDDNNLTFSNASIVTNDSLNTTWIIYEIAAGGSFTFSINLTLGGNSSGDINNTINVTNYTNGGFGGGNVDGFGIITNFSAHGNTTNGTELTAITIETRRPNITITKSDLDDSVTTAVNYTITLTNVGNSTAFNVTVIENYSTGTTFSTASIMVNDSDTTNSTFIIYSILAGASYTFTINLSVDSDAPTQIQNFVNVTNYTDGGEGNLDNGTITNFSSHGNVTNTSETTRVIKNLGPSQSGTGGSNSGSGPGGTLKIHEVGSESTPLTIWKADTTYLRMLNKDYRIMVTRIGRAAADFSVAGIPLSMNVGDTQSLDLDGDRKADLSVTLSNALFNRIMLNMQMLARPMQSSMPALTPIVTSVPDESSAPADDAVQEELVLAEEQVESPPRSNKRLVTAIIIALILLGVIGYGLLKGPLKPWMQKFSGKKTMVWAGKKRK